MTNHATSKRNPLSLTAFGICLAAATIGGGGWAIADTQGEWTGVGESNTIQSQDDQINSQYRLNIAFKGGDAPAYIEAIRKASNGLANIVVMEKVDQVRIPAVELRSVSIRSAIEFLTGQRSNESGVMTRLHVDVVEGESFREDSGEENGFSQVQQSSNIFVVTAEEFPERQLGQSAPTESNVWNVSMLLEYMSGDDVLGAIDTALPLATDNDEPNIIIRFHEETRILIGKGGSRELDLVGQVLDALDQSAHMQRMTEERSKAAADQIEDQDRKMREVIDSLQQDFRVRQVAAIAEQSELRHQIERLEMSTADLHQELDARQAVIESLKAELMSAHAKLADRKKE